MTIEAANQRLAAGAFLLTSSHPYFASAIWAMSRIPCANGGLVVDRHCRIWYEPTWVLDRSSEEIAAVLYHEVCHILRDHAGRGDATTDRDRWNLAADLEINDDLVHEGQPLPQGYAHPRDFKLPEAQLAEWYYTRLDASPSMSTYTCIAAPSTSESPDDAFSGRAREVTRGRCGSCATGIEDPDLYPLTDEALPDGITAGEVSLIRLAVARDIVEAHKLQGTVPGHLSAWAQRTSEPTINWQTELAALVRWSYAEVAGAFDYRYTRPSRRQSTSSTVIFPALRRPVPHVGTIIDTSGSMSDTDLNEALSEVDGILQAIGQRQGMEVLAVDTVVHATSRVTRSDQVVLGGRGGTDMQVGIAALHERRPRPDIAIVITDGYTPWPNDPPIGMHVIVVIVGTNQTAGPVWAKTVHTKAA